MLLLLGRRKIVLTLVGLAMGVSLALGQAGSRQNSGVQQTPEAKKPPAIEVIDGEQSSEPSLNPDSNPNPAAAIAEKSKEWTIGAVEETKNVGATTIKKVRDWRTNWFTGPFGDRTGPLV